MAAVRAAVKRAIRRNERVSGVGVERISRTCVDNAGIRRIEGQLAHSGSRFWNREWLATLEEELSEETVRIITRMSRQELEAEDLTEVGDPRFRSPRGE